MISACVGDDAALKVKTLLDMLDKIPTWEQILIGEDVQTPNTVPAQYFCAVNLAYRMQKAEHARPVLAFIRRLPSDMAAVFARALAAQHKAALLGPDLASFVQMVGDFSSASSYMIKRI